MFQAAVGVVYRFLYKIDCFQRLLKPSSHVNKITNRIKLFVIFFVLVCLIYIGLHRRRFIKYHSAGIGMEERSIDDGIALLAVVFISKKRSTLTCSTKADKPANITKKAPT